jgi:Zinc carboxypeptidase
VSEAKGDHAQERLLPELGRVLRLGLESLGGLVRVRQLSEVSWKGRSLPLLAFEIGSTDRFKPTLGLFGGVHGLEYVGSHVVLAFLESLVQQCLWDEELREMLQEVRLVSIPVVNPGGIELGTRSNPNGVDLMRNAPVEAPDGGAWLIGGHRLSPWLPWFRGKLGAPMEVEAQSLVDYVRTELFEAPFSLALDVHSGFGMTDRLWYPFARSREVFPRATQVLAMKRLLDRTLPYHVYRFEPQSSVYTTHGDLWDHLFDLHQARWAASDPARVFLPLTLEMGSWIWVRKNPIQLLSSAGIFNPVKPHRYRRTMRRHQLLLHFLLRAVRNSESWN